MSPNPTRFDRMLRPDEARKLVLARTKPLNVETVSLIDAIGRVLAVDLVAPENHPPVPPEFSASHVIPHGSRSVPNCDHGSAEPRVHGRRIVAGGR